MRVEALQYIAEIYKKYQSNPASIDSSWADFFTENGDTSLDHASWDARKIPIIDGGEKKTAKQPAKPEIGYSIQEKFDALRNGYRSFGHLAADLDPLGFIKSGFHPALDETLFTNDDLVKTIDFAGQNTNVSDGISLLKNIYSTKVGIEISHIINSDEYNFLVEQIESSYQSNLSTDMAFEALYRANAFENTLHKKFPGAKRFSIEGSDLMMIALEEIFLESTKLGVKQTVLGMAHRGRLNTLVHTTKKPYRALFSEFAGVSSIPESIDCAGDVKYHLGYSQTRKLSNGNDLYVTLTPNPSHLESVNPVVMGRARSKQDIFTNTGILPILIHGDAAMAGQGIVYECFQMANLEGYSVGGTIHIALNNQIGFTALQKDTKSSRYCTDVAKVIEAPVFHVNGYDVYGMMKVARIAAAYRQKFQKDVVIEIFSYRKYGHNEGDEPLFTQPVMYGKIKEMLTPADCFASTMQESRVLEISTAVDAELETEFELSKTYKPTEADTLGGKWSKIKLMQSANELFAITNTGVTQNEFDIVGGSISKIPENFAINPKIKKLLDERRDCLLAGKNLDWATAELLAYGTLLVDGFKVRLSGEDCERGTFSHRHSVYYDQKTNEKYYPLNNIAQAKEKYQVHNSLLSEFAVLGFEYGYSMDDPNSLVIWEGQFGDFANGAVTIYDQYVSSGEDKWLRMNGLVSLLPHGFEGQGPEHSSARLERYLQLCANNNMIVANPTTPANFFHILRRQVKSNIRKPMVIMSPKSLLRHKSVVSNIKDFLNDACFHPVIGDNTAKNIKKVLITSGKVYYDLIAKQSENVAIIRLEQYYPFPSDLLKKEVAKYKDAKEFTWVQEEPRNMGAWSFVRDYLEEACGHKVSYHGRKEGASPATGFAKVHAKEQDIITDIAR